MQPLVPYLLGQPHPQGTRLTSVQKCVRTVDIEEVGDNRHLTFFEMLGNWSLGDYFKHESIRWSFEFLTSKEHGLGMDPERLYVTVFAGDAHFPRDEEAIGIWKEVFAEVGIQAEVDLPLDKGGRIFSLSENWWGPAGATGPCGPDSEIHYNVENGASLTLEDGMPDFESGRIMEIWNNVFMQYNKSAPESFEPLEKSNVDTGMGLERITLIMQGKTVPFETDLFTPLVEVLHAAAPHLVANENEGRVVADHFRAAVMMITDGVVPANKDRGYVLRRLIRRATLHLNLPGTDWVESLVSAVATIYQEQYPIVRQLTREITKSLTEEVAKFQRTLEKGKQEIAKRQSLTGKDAFDLYQSYGFPLELTKEYAASKGVTFNEAEFATEFTKHQELSRTASAGQFSSGLADHSEATVAYHTATHLLHKALRNILGPEVQQKGSNITPERLRFDFSWGEKMTPEQLAAVETEINAQIAAHLPVTVATMSPDEAILAGAIGLFGHKYGDSVTVYTMGDYSKEICTGPHVENTKTLGKFSISKEEAVSAGVRRIKAILTH
jgi:alanyl-tRNA synthetase